MLQRLEKKLHKYEDKYMGGGQDANRVQALTAMGFPQDKARAALKQTNGDVAAAANILASGSTGGGGGGGQARVGGGYPAQPVMYTPQYPPQQQPQQPPAGGGGGYGYYPPQQPPQQYPPPQQQTPAYGSGGYQQQQQYPQYQQPYYPPPQQGGYAPIVPQYPPQQQQQGGYGGGGYPPQQQQAPYPPQAQPSAPPAMMAGGGGGGRKKALLIGINYTGTRAQLRGCVNDVRKMRQYLTRSCGFPDTPGQSLMVLTDDQRGANSPTRANILRGFQWLVSGAQPGDCLFLHYSGHGGQQRDTTGHEEDGYDETLLPLDYQNGHITDDEVWRMVVAPLPSGCRLTAVMDCCHSGTGMDLAFNWSRAGNRWVEETNPAHAAADVRLFSGCEDSQTSADTQTLFEAGGAMTIAFLQALEGGNGQRHTYRTFLDALHHHLRQRGFSQRPSLSATQRFNVDSPFSLADSVPNSNPQLGRLLRKRKKPKRHFGGGLADVLIAGAVGYVALNAAVGAAGLLGGLLFGGFD